MRQDQLSKSLIETFFPDFLHLAAPDAALRLRLRDASFMDKELFIDWPVGQRRELDLLARVPVEGGPMEGGEMYLLVHVEIESRARAGMDQRLWRYYMQLRLRHDLLVLPILVNLRGGRPGAGSETLEEGIEVAPTSAFRYRALGLSGCQAEEWLARPQPVAWAFAALMRPGRLSRAGLKMECLRRIERSQVSGWHKEVLVNWVQTQVQLSENDAAEFRRLLELKKNKGVRGMQLSWLGKAEAEGMKKGIEKGLQKGLAQGVKMADRQNRQNVMRMRRAVLQLLKRQFGPVPPPVRQRLQAIDSIEPLAQVVERVPLARSIEDLGLS
jgi:hypothetical protein